MSSTKLPNPLGSRALAERSYHREIRSRLDQVYEEVLPPWYPFRGEGRGIYAPIVDVAVGPFAIETRYETRYSEILAQTRDFIENLIENHNANVEDAEERARFDRVAAFNMNARCLLCIEVEDTGSRKHCLGDLVNASALGRIGLLIARTDAVLRTFIRQRAYLAYLRSVDKNTFRTDNALVLTEKQFNDCLAEMKRR